MASVVLQTGDGNKYWEILVRDGNSITLQDLSDILRELGKAKTEIWPNVTPSFQVDTILDQAAYLLSIGK